MSQIIGERPNNTSHIFYSPGQDTLTLYGHSNPIKSVHFSPKGNQIAGGYMDGSIKVWDAKSGQLTLSLKQGGSNIACVRFSPDGRSIASGSWDGTMKVWDAESGLLALAINGHACAVTGIDFSPDGKRIVSGGENETGTYGEIKMWNTSTGHETISFKKQVCGVRSVCFSPDGNGIVSGHRDNTVKLWNAKTAEPMLTLKGHSGKINSVCFSPDGKRIVTGSEDSSVKVWNTERGREVLTLKGHTGAVFSVGFSPIENRIVSSSADGMVKLWDSTTGLEILPLKGHFRSVNSVCFSPDGKRVVSASSDTTIKLWESQPWTEEQRAVRKDAEVVRVAAAIVDSYWQEEFKKGDITERIRADDSIAEAVQRKALQLVDVMGPTAHQLNAASWNTVCKAGSPSVDYERALRRIQAAIESEPNNGFYLNTLGVAQYRVGGYQAALTSLTRSESLNRAGFGEALPPDLVFLAMVHQKLGETDTAKERLQQVRQLIREPRWAQDTELQGFLQEAEALIEPPPSAEAAATDPATPEPTDLLPTK